MDLSRFFSAFFIDISTESIRSALTIDTSSTINTSVFNKRSLVLCKGLCFSPFDIHTSDGKPKNLFIVIPPASIAAWAVYATTATFLPLAYNSSAITFNRKVFPVPAPPVINRSEPFIADNNTLLCSLVKHPTLF